MRSAESDDINENINLSLGDLIRARTENVDRTRTHQNSSMTTCVYIIIITKIPSRKQRKHALTSGYSKLIVIQQRLGIRVPF
jgi:hypothetical protein